MKPKGREFTKTEIDKEIKAMRKSLKNPHCLTLPWIVELQLDLLETIQEVMSLNRFHYLRIFIPGESSSERKTLVLSHSTGFYKVFDTHQVLGKASMVSPIIENCEYRA